MIDLDAEKLARLATQIMEGETAVEDAWTAVFETVANHHFATDTTALLQLIDSAMQLPLKSQPAQQMRRYFLGVGAFRRAAYKEALTIFGELLAENGVSTHLRARALNARSVVCRVTGRLDEAIAGYEASLLLWQTLDDAHFQGIVTLNLGIIWYGLRDYAAAERFLRQAEGHFRTANSVAWLCKVQNELGLVQRDLGNWQAALKYFDAFVAESKAAGMQEDAGLGEANRGEVLLFLGKIEQAKTALQNGLRQHVGRTYQVDHLIFLGLAFQAEGDLKTAESHYHQALTLAEEIGRTETLPHALYHLGEALWQQGERESGLAIWTQAAEQIEASSEPLESETLKISLLGRWQQVFEALVLGCIEMGRVEEAFSWAERARARAFAEAFGATEVMRAAAIQAALADGEMALSFFTTGVLVQDLPLLRAIPKENPLRAHILPPAKTIRFLLTRDALSVSDCGLNPNLFATQSPRGFEATRFLKTAVLRRLRTNLLPDGALPERLLINPHGPLHRVPFQALFEDDERPFLRLIPSGTIFVQQQQARQPIGQGCVVAAYSGSGENGRLLPFAEVEARYIAAQLDGNAFVGADPKKERVREAAATCRWLHIACHGWFDDETPLASYLEMGDGERLTAQEVLDGWQLSARLVVLSACETGVSQLVRGDEPLGLVRAFLAVGAKAVLVSQWPIDDRATFLLMSRFYALLAENEALDLAEALLAAQEWLRHLDGGEVARLLEDGGEGARLETAVTMEGEERPFAEPIFWAGFVLVGG